MTQFFYINKKLIKIKSILSILVIEFYQCLRKARERVQMRLNKIIKKLRQIS